MADVQRRPRDRVGERDVDDGRDELGPLVDIGDVQRPSDGATSEEAFGIRTGRADGLAVRRRPLDLGRLDRVALAGDRDGHVGADDAAEAVAVGVRV